MWNTVFSAIAFKTLIDLLTLVLLELANINLYEKFHPVMLLRRLKLIAALKVLLNMFET